MTSVDASFTLTLSDVAKDFGRGRRKTHAVKPLSLEVTEKSRLGVVGESGSGKSTLARIMVGLETQTGGTITYRGRSIHSWLSERKSRLEFRRRVQYVAQDTTSFDPRQRFSEAVARPLRILRGVTDPAEVRQSLIAIANQLELSLDLYSRYPDQVSGGQRQRFALARSLIAGPELLICDEVVSALDVSVQGTVLNLIKQYTNTHGMGLIFVAHGLPAVTFISDEAMVMRHGEVVERGTVRQIVSDAQHPYTKQLFDAYMGTSARKKLNRAIS